MKSSEENLGKLANDTRGALQSSRAGETDLTKLGARKPEVKELNEVPPLQSVHPSENDLTKLDARTSQLASEIWRTHLEVTQADATILDDDIPQLYGLPSQEANAQVQPGGEDTSNPVEMSAYLGKIVFEPLHLPRSWRPCSTLTKMWRGLRQRYRERPDRMGPREARLLGLKTDSGSPTPSEDGDDTNRFWPAAKRQNSGPKTEQSMQMTLRPPTSSRWPRPGGFDDQSMDSCEESMDATGTSDSESGTTSTIIVDRGLSRIVLSIDIIQHIYRYCDFRDIALLSTLSKAWRRGYSHAFAQRELELRWPAKHINSTYSSATPPFRIDGSDWKRRLLAREYIKLQVERVMRSKVRSLENIKETVLRQVELLYALIQNHAPADLGQGGVLYDFFQLECFRWMCELFDDYCARQASLSPREGAAGRDEESVLFPVPKMSNEMLRILYATIRRPNGKNPGIHTLCKTFGILAINEKNREGLSQIDLPTYLVRCLSVAAPLDTCHASVGKMSGSASGLISIRGYEPETVSSILWAMVIMCRPLGGREGETLISFANENFRNTHKVAQLNGHFILLRVMDRFATHPGTLSKAFWLVVNLALVEDVKRALIEHKVVHRVIAGLRRFPNHEELNYRACFALINVGMRHTAKKHVADLGGITELQKCMNRFPKNCDIQRCALNALRSLLVGDVFGFAEFWRANGGLELFDRIERNFQNNQKLLNITASLRFLLDHIHGIA